MPKVMNPSEQQKTVGFVAGGIGDQLYHFTQLEHLAKTSLSGTIDLVCMHTRPMREIASCCPWIGDIIDAQPFRRLSSPARFWDACRTLRAGAYGRAAVFHRSTSFKLACLAAGIPRRIGLSSGAVDRLLLTDPVDVSGGGGRRAVWGHRPFIGALDQHFSAQGLSYDGPAPIQPRAEQSDEVRAVYGALPRPWTVVNLFVGDPHRRWPPGHAEQMLKAFHDRFGGTLFVNTGPDAISWHDRLISLWTGPEDRLVNMMPDEAPIPFMIAFYHQADLYLGVDSFTSNLALNCDLPAVILFNKASDSLTFRSRSYPLAPAPEGPLDRLTEDDFHTAFSHFDEAPFSKDKQR